MPGESTYAPLAGQVGYKPFFIYLQEAQLKIARAKHYCENDFGDVKPNYSDLWRTLDSCICQLSYCADLMRRL